MEQLSEEQSVSVSRISALVVINALIFEEILSNDDRRVSPLRTVLQNADFVGAIAEHWHFILTEIDYFPIFEVARSVLLSLTTNDDTDRALRSLANIALSVVRQRTALRHDLMGRVYHRLLGERETKSLATFYTSVPAATLLLKIALDPSRWTVNWADEDQLSHFRLADLACGTGTLLMAAAEVITDNYVRSCMTESQTPDFGNLQRLLMQDIIFGYDVLPSARHLTASTLALRSPKIKFDTMNLWSLPFGEPGQRLGSIEFLIDRRISIQDFYREAGSLERVSATAKATEATAYLPDLDLCVMNPPFTRSSHANLLFGSVPSGERAALQKRLAKILKVNKTQATGTAGLGSVFVAIAHRALKPNGRLALVLPKAVLSGGAWQPTRDLLSNEHLLEYLIVSHDPQRWNFSDNTNLSEALIVAKKKSRPDEPNPNVICVNLWKNPKTVFESLGVADSLTKGAVPSLEDSQGTRTVELAGIKFGETFSVPWKDMKQSLWITPCAFAQSDLTRTVYSMLNRTLYLPRIGDTSRRVPLKPLKDIAQLGPDIRDIYDGFELSSTKTSYPAFWGHEANEVVSLSQNPNSFLSPLAIPRSGRHLRHPSDLWPKAARVAIATRLRLNTQRLTSVRLTEKVLSNVWWPLLPFVDNEQLEKVLVLWLNSTLGLLVLLAHRQEVQGSWVAFQKPILNALPVLNIEALPSHKITLLADIYDTLGSQTMLPFSALMKDGTRLAVDEAISDALDLPDISVLRDLLSCEPILSGKPIV